MRSLSAGFAIQAAVAIAIALVVAPGLRTVTAGLNTTVGRLWPFSMARCHAPTTPGCAASASTEAPQRGRAGRS